MGEGQIKGCHFSKVRERIFALRRHCKRIPGITVCTQSVCFCLRSEYNGGLCCTFSSASRSTKDFPRRISLYRYYVDHKIHFIYHLKKKNTPKTKIQGVEKGQKEINIILYHFKANITTYTCKNFFRYLLHMLIGYLSIYDGMSTCTCRVDKSNK